MRHAVQLRPAGPHDLDADAEQHERHQPDHHQRTDLAQLFEHRSGVLEDEVEDQRDERGTRGGHRRTRDVLHGRRGDLRAEGDRGGDGARPRSQRKRQREEATARDLGVRQRRRLLGGRRVHVVVLGAVEQAPRRRGHEQAAAEAHDRQRDAEDRQDVGADQHRHDDHEPAVDGDLPGEPRGERAIAAERRHENRRGAERVDDRQQGHRHENQRLQEGDGDQFLHGTPAVSRARASRHRTRSPTR